MRLNVMTLAFLLAARAPWAARAFAAHPRHRRALPPLTTAATTATTATTATARARYKVVGGPSSSPSTAVFAASSTTGTPPTPSDDGTSPFGITTPIYYVNDKPHIGHAYTSLACDVIARYMRHSGRDVRFLSGTDEHGQKVETTARNAGMEPMEFCDAVSQTFRDLLGLMNVSNDRFIRTTEDHHKGAVRHLWKTLDDNGAVYLGSYEGWYSVRDECYYNESELVDGKAPTGAEVSWVKKEDSYFFRLSDYADRLLEHYESHPDFIAPDSRRNEVISFVKGGLRDLSISRTTFDWGVKVPGDESHVMYVWIDALANYISALGYPESIGEGSDFDKYWPASLHVVGKDILRFHAVYWPAFLMAAGLPLPRRIFAHGWWTKDGEKISKSLGNVIDPVELVGKYGVDPTRFFLMSEVTFGSDGDFSDERMVYKVNANLSNELGNLNQRIMTLVYKNCGGATPSEIGTLTAEDEAMLATARSLRSRTGMAISNQSIDKYVQHMISAVWDANKYIDAQAPWVLRKTDVGRMNTVLYVLMEVMRHVAVLYQPLMPASSNAILDQLGVPADERDFDHLGRGGCEIRLGREVIKPFAVFPRFEVPVGAAA